MTELPELPGALEHNMAVQKQEWPCTMDAYVWAKKFCEKYPQFDHGEAVAWFANAIMAGYDTARMRLYGRSERDE